MRQVKVSYLVIGLLATQVLLGCQPSDGEDVPKPIGVTVPAGLEHPKEVVGEWKETKGGGITLNADGSGEFLTKVTLTAEVTKGAPRSFDQKTKCTWGTKDGKIYFTGMNGSGDLSYEWKLSGGNLRLEGPGTKKDYAPVKK